MLAGFSAWLLPFGWQQRHLYFKDYTFSAEQAQALRHYPEAMLAFGQKAWFALDAEGAARYYRAVVTRDAGHMAAWLKLAEAEAAFGSDGIFTGFYEELFFRLLLTGGIFLFLRRVPLYSLLSQPPYPRPADPGRE